jgi:hypothetical protein
MKGTGDKVKTVKLVTESRTWLKPKGIKKTVKKQQKHVPAKQVAQAS